MTQSLIQWDDTHIYNIPANVVMRYNEPSRSIVTTGLAENANNISDPDKALWSKLVASAELQEQALNSHAELSWTISKGVSG